MTTIREKLDALYYRIWGRSAGYLDALAELIHMFLPVEEWGFSMINKSDWELFYQSKRGVLLSAELDTEQYRYVGVVIFRLARPGAPLHDIYRMENGKKCLCWTSLGMPLYLFLDGYTPAEAVQAIRQPIELKKAPVEQAFAQTTLAQELWKSEPAYSVAEMNFVWEWYGDRLFRLFDPSNSTEWHAYRQFLYEFEKLILPPDVWQKYIEGRSLFPPAWEIC